MRAAARWLPLPVIVTLGLAFAWPMALAVQAAFASSEAWVWLVDDYARSRIAGAFLQAILSLAAVLAVAMPLAWLHHHWRIPGSKGLLAVHAATFALPVFVVVAGLRETAGAGGWLHRLAGLDLLTAVGPWGSVVLGNAYYNTGLAALLLHTALARRPHRLEQAAATLGASPAQARRRVLWPLLRPSVLAAALLVFLFSFASFGVVLMLGQGAIDTLDTLLYANLRGAFPREDRGAVLALVQVGVQALLLVGIFTADRRGSRLGDTLAQRVQPSHWAATAVAWLAAGVAVLPALAVLVGGFQLDGAWSLQAWRTLADPAADGHLTGFRIGHALAMSALYAVAAVVFSVLLTLCLGYASRGGVTHVVEAFAFLPLGTSSVVLGFAYLLAFTGRAWLPLAGTPWLILAAHTLVAFPFVARTVLPALRSLDPRLDQAAETLGARTRSRILRLHLPLLRGPLVVACAFAAILSLGDFGASLLLMTDELAGVTVWIHRHGGPGAFDPLARAQSTALAALLLVLTMALLLAANFARGRRRTA